jgi:hypothetical protein
MRESRQKSTHQQKYKASTQTSEVNFTLKIRVVEDLHGNFLFAFVQLLELGVVDSDVLVNILARQLNLFVFPVSVNAHKGPVTDSRGCTKYEKQEQVGFETTILDDGSEGFDNIRDDKDEDGQMDVAKRTIALCETDEGRILDSGVLCDPHCGGGHGWELGGNS